jgi:hypothetical protein
MNKLLFLCGIFLVISCNKAPHITRSFCYWKTNYSSYSIDKNKADSLAVNHMYMRFFDVGWNPYDKKAEPIATMWDVSDETNRLNITPSVYITNDVLLQSTRPQLAELAQKICKRITHILDTSKEKTLRYVLYKYGLQDEEKNACEKDEAQIFKGRFNEILIDCDWTVKSKNNYFYLLGEIKRQMPGYALSATIRLWQYRDYETAGIPPADKGLLMCYNMSNPTSYDNENSIGSSKIMGQYLNHNDYPIKLDAALPVFSWALVFRGGKFKGILPNDYYNIENKAFKKIAQNHYVLQSDIVIKESYYRNGDEIRIERVSDAEMKKMIALLKKNIDLEGSRVTFFSWDENYIDSYGINAISGYYSLFGE